MEDVNVSFIAQQIGQQHQLVNFQEDLFRYGGGLYRQMEPGWLHYEVQQYCTVNAFAAKAADVADIARLVGMSCFVEARQQPPFSLSSRQRASVIVATNGVLTIDDDGTLSFGPHSSDLFAIAGVDYPYDPAATCPMFVGLTEWMVGDAEVVRLLQQFCCWSLMPNRPKLEKMLWLFGAGKNGKSTWLNAVRHVLGEDATSAVGLEAISGAASFKMWPTLYRIANFTMDGTTRRLDVAAVNAYVSGDPITLNRKYQRQLTIEPATTLFVGSNTEPIVKDPSDAWKRRILPIYCGQRPTSTDPGLIHKLKAEASGILNWMLAALPDLVREQRFDVPRSVDERIESITNQATAARQFVSEKIEAGESDDFLASKQVMDIFGVWCATNGYRKDDLGTMKEEVDRAFHVQHKRCRAKGLSVDRPYGWLGVRWQREEVGHAASFQQAVDTGERVQELENQLARIMGSHNQLVVERDAATREVNRLAGERQLSDDVAAKLRRELADERAAKPANVERYEMAERIAKQSGVIERQQAKITVMRTKERILKGKLDKFEKSRAINRTVLACNTPELEVEMDPAEKAVFDALMKQLEGDDDVDDDETERTGPAGPVVAD